MADKTEEENKGPFGDKHPLDELFEHHGGELMIKVSVEDPIAAREILSYIAGDKKKELLLGCRIQSLGMGGLMRNGLESRRKQLLEQVHQFCDMMENEILGAKPKAKVEETKE